MDNTTVERVINNKIQLKQTKAMDMRFHWLHNCKTATTISNLLEAGGANLADYWTKHHAPAHHVNIRAEFLTRVKNIHDARQLASKNQSAK
jgi:hypothetical protein